MTMGKEVAVMSLDSDNPHSTVGLRPPRGA